MIKGPDNSVLIKLPFVNATSEDISKIVLLLENNLKIKTKKRQDSDCIEFSDKNILVHLCKGNLILGFSLDVDFNPYLELIGEIINGELETEVRGELEVALTFSEVSSLLNNFVNPENKINTVTPILKVEECESMIIKYGPDFYSLSISEDTKQITFTDVVKLDADVKNYLADKIKEFKRIVKEYERVVK